MASMVTDVTSKCLSQYWRFYPVYEQIDQTDSGVGKDVRVVHKDTEGINSFCINQVKQATNFLFRVAC